VSGAWDLVSDDKVTGSPVRPPPLPSTKDRNFNGMATSSVVPIWVSVPVHLLYSGYHLPDYTASYHRHNNVPSHGIGSFQMYSRRIRVERQEKHKINVKHL
jgi:hypothetical protein